MASKTVKVGDDTVTLEPFKARKAIRVIRTIEKITEGVPEILNKWAEFTRQYEATNVTEVDRAFARSENPPQPVMDEEPIVVDGNALTDDQGRVLVRRTPKLIADHDENGKAIPGTERTVLGPDPLSHMTEQDWQASGNKLRIPRSPSMEERIVAIFPMALNLAEEQTLELLALLSWTNQEVRQAMRGDYDKAIEDRKEWLYDAPADDLLELAVTAGEVVDEQFSQKVKALGERLPNALRLFGLSPKSRAVTSTNSVSETKPTSSTDSQPPTDGDRDESLTEPTGVSSSLSPSV